MNRCGGCGAAPEEVWVAGLTAAGVELRGGRSAALGDATLDDIVGDTSGRGIDAGGAGLASLTVRGHIFSSISHEAVFVAEPAGEVVTLDFSALDAVLDPVGAVLGDDIARAPAGFTQPLLGDFGLRAGSACIDAGDPAAPCDDEPVSEDGSCRRDLGHLAGTEQARAR